ncbi:MAG: AAA family ATPase, partial [Acidobacteriota bacterium]
WRQGPREVDFVLRRGPQLAAIEVKSGLRREHAPGLSAFEKVAGPVRKLLVGTGGIPLEEFFETPIELWLRPLAER